MIEIIILPSFEKEARKLNKKYKSFNSEIANFIALTEKDGIQGVSLGNGIYKARLSVKSKIRGKSGGLRVISYREIILSLLHSKIFLVAIYDKSEISTLTKVEIEKILRDYI
jgi:hypothetical protein